MPMYGAAGGAGTGRETYTQFLQRSVKEAQEQAEAAKRISDIVQAQAGTMPGAEIPGMAEGGIKSLLAGGMSQEEKTARRRQVTGGFQRAIGGMAAKTGRAGFFAPQSVAGAAMGRPARALAGGLGDLAAQEQQAKLASIGKGTQIAAGLYQYPWEAAKAAQTGYGDIYRKLQGARAYGTMYGPQASRTPYAMFT